MTCTIYHISGVSASFIRDMDAFINKPSRLDTPCVLRNNLINPIGSNGEPSPLNTWPSLDSLSERVQRARKYLETLLGDYSAIGRAKLKAFYKYMIKLFEELREMCPDWMTISFAVAIALMIAFIIGMLLLHAPGMSRNKRALKLEWDLRVLQWKNNQKMKLSSKSGDAELLRQMIENIREVDETRARGGRIPPRLSPGSNSRRAVDISIELLKYELML